MSSPVSAVGTVIGNLPLGNRLPSWIQQLIAWFLITVFGALIAMAAVQTRVSGLESRMDRHEVDQEKHEELDKRDKDVMRQQMLTVDRFNQFENDQTRRMDRMENKIDRLVERH
jgi:flagellar biosynthesis/type III secretory pathway M-ring protein FliF/YscJ